MSFVVFPEFIDIQKYGYLPDPYDGTRIGLPVNSVRMSRGYG